MSDKFYVRLTLLFADGTISETVTDIVDAIALDRALKAATLPKGKDSITDLFYSTLRELPGDDTQKA